MKLLDSLPLYPSLALLFSQYLGVTYSETQDTALLPKQKESPRSSLGHKRQSPRHERRLRVPALSGHDAVPKWANATTPQLVDANEQGVEWMRDNSEQKSWRADIE